MKDKRNCGMNYPIYPTPMMNTGMYPPMNTNMGFPVGYGGGITSNTFEQQLNTMDQRINMLEQRVNRLEGTNSTTSTNYNKYNDSNYYMV